MNRAEKKNFVEDLGKGINEAGSFALMSFSGLSVEQMTSLRISLRKQDIRCRVLKNTLARRAFDASEFKEAAAFLKGPTMMAFGGDDAVATAKAVQEWADKEDFNLTVNGGVAMGEVMDAAKVQALSKLPGREELFVSFLWCLKHHPTRMLYALKDNPQKIVYALSALKEKKEE